MAISLNPLSWIGAVLQPVADGFKSWNDGRVKIKEAKINATIARYNAEAKMAEKQLDAETDWDLEALRQSANSWKDEWLLFIFTMPMIGSFIPVVQDYVITGWGYIAKAPLWYQTCLLGMVAASFGLRWWFHQNKLKVIGGGE